MRTDDTNYGHDYFETLDGGDGYQDSTMWEDIAHTIKEVFATDEGTDRSGELHTVDVGCAKGYLVRHLRRRGFDAWGLDISEYAITNAPADTAEYLRQFDLTGRDASFFGTKNFTFAVCLETMEHIPEDQVGQALLNIFHLVEPGSQVLFTICTDKQPGWDSDPTHVTIKTHEWWQHMLEKCGFHYGYDDIKRQNKLGHFWLFSQHDGVFVVHRPE